MVSGDCPGPMKRRAFLQAGALALGGLSLEDVLAARAASGNKNADTAVILLYLHGGASQLETYDLKPEAPTSYRSIFQPIPTCVPGMDICELFPRQAKIADKIALVRSLNHDVGIHSDGGIIALTGKRPTRLDPTSQSKSEHPDFGSVASRVRGLGTRAMPPYVAIPQRLYMTRPTYLGPQHAGFEVGDPSRKNFSPPHLQIVGGRDGKALDDRRRLIGRLDRFRNDLDLHEVLVGTDNFRDIAFQMLSSPQIAKAFNISKEPKTLRDRYGRNLWGQGCLLARRLAEAGTAVTTLFIDAPCSGWEYTNWDDHPGNGGRKGHFGNYMRIRLPFYDQALSTLIEDIYARDLDRKILVVVTSEFGRTPRLRTDSAGTGRDHWPQAYTVLLSGGGLRTGQVVGATNSKAEHPTARPYKPQDLLATIYRHLGIDIGRQFIDYFGRPIPVLYDGEPIRELI